MDILQTVVQGVSIYLGFVAYENIDILFWWLFSIIVIGIINSIFIVWSIKLLAFSYLVKAK